MKHVIVKFIVGTLLGIAVAFLLAFNVLLLWVATGPRSLNVFTPYIEAALEPADHNYSIKIDETWLIWDGWKHPIDIQLRRVNILSKERQRISTFPEISLGLDLLSLAEGKLLPTSLTIMHPDLLLFQNDDRSLSFGFKKELPGDEKITPEVAEVPLAAVLAPLLEPDEKSNLRKLYMVTIVNADISVGNVKKGIFFTARDAQMVFKNNRHGMNAYGSAQILYDNIQSQVSAQFQRPKESQIIDGTIKVADVMPGKLSDLFSNNTILSAMKLPISGESKLAIDMDGNIQRLDFNVDGGKGTIETDKLEAAIPVTSLHAEGALTSHGSEIAITKSNVDIEGMEIIGDGVVQLENNDAAVQANIVLKNIPTENASLFWPPSLAPQTREWVTKNITEGVITSAQAHFNIAHGDLAKPALPKEDVAAVITLSQQNIHYLPGHPPITHVQGTIHIDGVSMDATIASADYLKQTKMFDGKVIIEDLNADNPYIKVSFDTHASAKDAVHFLGLPPLKHAKRLGLDEETIEGSVSGHGSVGFNFFAPHDAKGRPLDPDIAYEIAGEVKGISQQGFMQKFDIADVSGSVAVNNKSLEFKGSGSVNGANVSESDVKYVFSPDPKDKGFDTFINATATAPVEVLPRFGYPAIPFVSGKLGIKTNLKEGEGIETSQTLIDLTNAGMELNLPAMHWSKPALEPATIEISAEKKNDITSLSSFQIKGKNIDIHGSSEMSKDLSGIRMIELSRFICAGTDIDHIIYEKTDDGLKIDARGNSADLTAWLGTSGENNFSFEHFPAVVATLDVKQLVLGKGRVLGNVKGTLNCDSKQCGSADIAGTTVDNKPFQFRILHNPKGNRQLSLRANSAGAFLKAVGVFSGMEGGDLSVTGSYADNEGHSVLKGSVDINEYTVKDAPVLAKMLSLASLTGFFDTLRGKGIVFSKLRAPFTLSKDVITFQDAKTHGDAIGMTAEGTITFPKRTLDLQGTIIPSYTLNHVLGNVPLVGNLLTGGEGQGVFAARYSIKGSDEAPEVSVNPLSILTPGFLRGVFDVFDRPKTNPGDAE